MQYYRDYSAIFSRENNGYVKEKQNIMKYRLWKSLF